MKEFGLYVLKPSYINRFSAIDSSLPELKGSSRPFICIKSDNFNWVIPIASLDPDEAGYRTKREKYRNLFKLDREQAAKDNKPCARAITIFNDLTGLKSNDKFQSVAEYYNALPVKHKYCKKYRDNNRQHITITDKQTRAILKNVFNENLSAKERGEEVGFIKAKINEGKTYFVNYPKKSIQIREELYREHFALKKAEQERKDRTEQRSAEVARKKTLKGAAKGALTSKVMIEIEPQHVYWANDTHVMLKRPSEKAGVKEAFWLSKADIVLGKDNAKVVGVTEELQRQHSLPLPKGQPKRFLK